MSRDFSQLAARVVSQSAAARPRLLEMRQQAKAGRSDTQKRIAELKREAEQHAEIQQYARQIPGFFSTPRDLAARMVELADIDPGMSVLEPSAGAGHIADAIRDAGHAATTLEISFPLYDLLRRRGHNPHHVDFMEWGELLSKGVSYDRIIANPPFERGQDIDHVCHAFNLLRPGGKLVAIMGAGSFFRSDRKATGFREWLDTVGGDAEKLPPDTFQKSDVPTSVQTYLVQIERS